MSWKKTEFIYSSFLLPGGLMTTDLKNEPPCILEMKKSRPKGMVGSSQCLERIKIRMTHRFQL